MEHQDQTPLVFTLELKERPVVIDGEEYAIVELSGTERDKYLNSLNRRLKTSPDGKSQTVKEFDGLMGTLLVKSLVKCTDAGRVGVDLKTIQSWPASVVKSLYDVARDLSALNDKDDEDDEKNA